MGDTMRNFALFFTIFLVAVMIIGCKDPEPEHVHTYSEKWSSNATHHWKVATCEHTDQISEKAKHSFVDEVCSVCSLYTPEGFVLVSAGTFNMGSNSGQENNKPVHEVTITKPFYMGKYEVTQAEYESVIGTNPSNYQGNENLSAEGEVQENRPVESVSWYDVIVYCNKRSLAEDLTPCYTIKESVNPSDWGNVPTSVNVSWNTVKCDFSANGYRLPTEAEWEYAARAGDSTVDKLTYSGTSDLDKLGDYAWYGVTESVKTHEVGKKLPNAFGVYDMSGNAWEWCWNWFTGSYDTESEGGSDPTGVELGSTRIVRGGWAKNEGDYCAVSYRNGNKPFNSASSIGFRVVRSCVSTTE